MSGWTLPLASASPVGHVTDKPIVGDFLISNVTVMLVLGGLATMALVIPAARRIGTGGRSLDDLRAKGTLANLVEAVCLFLRDDVFRPILREQTDRYIPMLWTFFWFILICNLLGLVPLADITAALGVNVQDDHRPVGIGGTATQSIWVTGTLAVISFLWFNGSALLKDPVAFLKHLTAGAPWYMWGIMVPVEIIGMFVKPMALALRLFANMTGGHIIVATLLGFVVSLGTGLKGVAGNGLALLPLLGTILIYFLEILVAFIQAYIFTFLSGLFLAQLVVHDHGHEGHEDGHGHGPADVAAAAHG